MFLDPRGWIFIQALVDSYLSFSFQIPLKRRVYFYLDRVFLGCRGVNIYLGMGQTRGVDFY